MHIRGQKAQSSFELLITLSFGLGLLLPIVVIAFVQVANANTSLAASQAQQATNKIAGAATVVGTEGPPAKQLVQVFVPRGVKSIYIGNVTDGIGHEIIFVLVSPQGLSYVTSYTPVNVSGNIGSLSNQGSYLVNVSAQVRCPANVIFPCVYVSPVV